MKVLFMGTPRFAAASLEALLEAGHEVPAVVTRPDARAGRGLTPSPSAVKRLAAARAIPVLQPRSMRSPDLLETIASLRCDLCVVAAFGRILPQALLEAPPLGAINVHASLLPRYRGAAPVARAIERGETTTGVTIMRMVASLDAGGILAARATPIGEEETAGELEERLAALGASLLVETIEGLGSGSVVERPQDEAEVTWAPPLRKEEGRIRWSEHALVIARKARAFNPWPGARARFAPSSPGGFTLWRARAIESAGGPPSPPGLVLEASAGPSGRVVVACGTGALRIDELQPDGKRALEASAAVSGRYLKPGVLLGDG